MEKKLSKDWLTEGLMDFEYKKYLLLAYLQFARKNFSNVMLYPPLADLIQHYRELRDLKARQELTSKSFKKEIKGFDLEKFKLIYSEHMENEDSLSLVQELIEYALPEIQSAIDEGTGIYEFLEKQITFQEIGLTPLYRDEGYLLLQDNRRTINVFRYSLSKIICNEQNYRSLHTQFISEQKADFINTPQQIKLWLSREFKDLPNPSVFEVFSELDIPVQETYLPLAKRLLIKELSSAA